MSAALRIDPPAAMTPRETLAAAIAERNRAIAAMAVTARARDAAEAAERAAVADVDALAAAETEGWARWVENRTTQPHPVDAGPRKAELVAVRHAATKAADAARTDYLDAETQAQRDLPRVSAAIVDAARQVLVAEAARLGAEYASAVELAMQKEAALMGIKASFAGSYGDGVALVEVALQGGRSADAAMRRRGELQKHNAVIRARWAGLAERLANDPDATASEDST